jgi:hypothetical protein
MTIHNERCDCCGNRLPRIPSEFHPGEEIIGGQALGAGQYCQRCADSISRASFAGQTPDAERPVPCPVHQPVWGDGDLRRRQRPSAGLSEG